MIILNLPNLTQLAWYYYVIAGFLVGSYMHSKAIHHAIHWLAIKSLQVAIWLLKHSDPQYKPTRAKPQHTAQIIGKQEGIEVEETQVKEWLQKNPELKVMKP